MEVAAGAKEVREEFAGSEAAAALSDEQWTALGVLLKGGTQVEAGNAAGVSDRTVRAWLKCDTFRRAMQEGREMMLRELATALSLDTQHALAALREEMATPSKYAMGRVLAAKAVLEMSLKAVDKVDHADRLRRIEADVAAGKEALARLEG